MQVPAVVVVIEFIKVYSCTINGLIGPHWYYCPDNEMTLQ